MKLIQVYKLFISLIVFSGYAIIGWLSFAHPDSLLQLGAFTAIVGYALILVCLTPIGGKRLGDASLRLPWVTWMWAVAKAHLVMFTFTLSVLLAFFSEGPLFIKPIDFQSAFQLIQHYSETQWGIFPWGAVGFWAVVMAYVAYYQKAPPYPYAFVKNYWPKILEPMVKTFIEALQFGATTQALTITAVAVILLFALVIEGVLKVSHYQLVPITFTFLSFFILLFIFQMNQARIRRWQDSLTLSKLFSITIVSLIGLLVLSAITGQWIMVRHPELSAQAICHQCTQFFGTVPDNIRFAAFYWGWWLMWVPIGGSYLANLSKGRTIREIVFGLFCFPALFWALLKGSEHLPLHELKWMLSPVFLLGLVIALPFLTWWMLSKILQNSVNSDFFLSGYLKETSQFKRNRLWVSDGSKVVGLSKYAHKVIFVILATVLLQTSAGWYGIQIQTLAMAVFVIVAIYVGCVIAILRLLRRKS